MSFFLSFSFFFGPSEKALLMSVTVLTGGQLLSLSQECCQVAPEMGEQEKGKFTTWVNKGALAARKSTFFLLTQLES